MKGFRTVLFNVVGIGTLITTQYSDMIPHKALPYITLGMGVGNIILRTITTTPIGKTEVISNAVNVASEILSKKK